MFVCVIGRPEHIEIHNDRLVIRIGPVMHQLDSAFGVVHHTAASLTKRTHPFRLAIVSRRR